MAAKPVSAAFDGAAALEHVTIIADEIRRLDQVVQGFLKFTRPEDLRLQPLQLSLLLDDVRQVVGAEAERQGVALHIECPRDLPDIYGDPGMLRQAFLNLALNACQVAPDKDVELRAVAGEGVCRIAICDRGPGVPSEIRDRIFEPFFTTRVNGTGLGLAIVKRLMELQEGTVQLKDRIGGGTIAEVTVPRAA